MPPKGGGAPAAQSAWQELLSPEGQKYFWNSQTNKTQWEKPEELKTAAELADKGDWVWIPHPDDAFCAGKMVEKLRNGSSLCEDEAGRQQTAPADFVFDKLVLSSLDNAHFTSDLVLLSEMNKPLILHTLKERFRKNEIYTNVGNILIALNPYQRLDIYSPKIMDAWQGRGSKRLNPHVFEIAANAFEQMVDKKVNQSVIISGESGAGKTECTKYCLQYIAHVAGSNSTGGDHGSSYHSKILKVNPILEAFGNAKTLRNNNSSRFGKYCELFFDNANKIVGASNTNYLLEKVRVVQFMENERTYHVFYQLAKGAPKEYRDAFGLAAADKIFHRALGGTPTSLVGVDDAEDFKEVMDAMATLELSAAEQKDIFQIVALVLHLGDLAFTDKDGKAVVDGASQNTCATVAKLMGVTEKDLTFNILTRTMKIGSEVTNIPLTQVQAEQNRDALAKFIYGNLFDWIVLRCNQSMAMMANAIKARTIGILDIFGFEIFVKNSFEQLCINFTNEKLQRFFNENTFNLEENVYKSEAIQFDHVKYKDNQPVLDLIEIKGKGLMPMLDEEVKMPKGSDQTFLDKLIKEHDRKTPAFASVLKCKTEFMVRHYAGDVAYDSVGFLEKNRDTLSEDALSLLYGSTFKFMNLLFKKDGGGSANRKRTLGSQFCTQLDALMAALRLTNPHYIRCIKPNPNKRAQEFAAVMSLEQLTYSGVFEAVEIRKKGYPFRLKYRDFFYRYRAVQKGITDPSTIKAGPLKDDYRPACVTLIKGLLGDADDSYRLGKTMILYKGKQHSAMELQRFLCVERDTKILQTNYRGHLARTFVDALKHANAKLIAACAKKDVALLKQAIIEARKNCKYPQYRRLYTPPECGTQFPLPALNTAEAMLKQIVREKEIRTELEAMVHKGLGSSETEVDKSFAQLKDMLKEAQGYGMGGDTIAKAQGLRDIRQGVVEFDGTLLLESIARAKKLKLDVLPSVAKDMAKAQEVLDRIEKEKKFTELLGMALHAKGKFAGGKASIDIMGNQLQQSVSDAKSFGVKTKDGRHYVVIGEATITLRQAQLNALGTEDLTKWKNTAAAAAKVQQAVADAKEVNVLIPPCVEEEVDGALKIVECLTLLAEAITSYDEVAIDDMLKMSASKIDTMDVVSFPLVTRAEDARKKITAIKVALKDSIASVSEAGLTGALRLADDFKKPFPVKEYPEAVEMLARVQQVRADVDRVMGEHTKGSTSSMPTMVAVSDECKGLGYVTDMTKKLASLIEKVRTCLEKLQFAIDKRDEAGLEKETTTGRATLKLTDDALFPEIVTAEMLLARIKEVKSALTLAVQHVHEDELVNALAICDELKYETKDVQAARALKEKVVACNRACESALKAQYFPKIAELETVITQADAIALHTRNLDTLREQIGLVTLVAAELTEALSWRDEAALVDLMERATELRMVHADPCSSVYECTVQAADMLGAITSLRQGLDQAWRTVDEKELVQIIADTDYYYYDTEQVRAVRQLRDDVVECNATIPLVLDIMEPVSMSQWLDKADSIRLASEDFQRCRELLFDVGEEKFVQMQLRQCVKHNDSKRKKHLMIVLKDIMFAQPANAKLFDWKNFNKLYKPKDWATEKFASFDREALADSMLAWSEEIIHCPLTQMEEYDTDKMKRDKKNPGDKLSACADASFRNILAYQHYKRTKRTDHEHCCELLERGKEYKDLRDEIYCQLIKQTTNTPDSNCKLKAWELIVYALETFLPSPGFENYLELWLRTNASQDIVDHFHTRLFDGRPEQAVPTDMRFIELKGLVRAVPVPSRQIQKGFTGFRPQLNILTPEREYALRNPPPFTGKTNVERPASAKPYTVQGKRGGQKKAAETSNAKAPSNYPVSASASVSASSAPAAASTPASDVPPPPPSHRVSQEAKASPWTAYFNAEYGQYYYNNNITGETTWERPSGPIMGLGL